MTNSIPLFSEVEVFILYLIKGEKDLETIFATQHRDRLITVLDELRIPITIFDGGIVQNNVKKPSNWYLQVVNLDAMNYELSSQLYRIKSVENE